MSKPRIKLKVPSNVLQMHPQRPWPTLVEHCEYLLQMAKEGEMLGIYEVVKWRGYRGPWVVRAARGS